jgi:hypothetical protein
MYRNKAGAAPVGVVNGMGNGQSALHQRTVSKVHAPVLWVAGVGAEYSGATLTAPSQTLNRFYMTTLSRLTFILSGILWALAPTLTTAEPNARIVLEAARPTRQEGSRGKDLKQAASGGEVLGQEFGAKTGHFAEYAFEMKKAIAPVRIGVRYARGLPEGGWLEVTLDGKKLGLLRYDHTGGWGDAAKDFRWVSLQIPKLAAGKHVLRLTVVARPLDKLPELPTEVVPPASPILDLIGRRTDKRSVGHGRNVALYTGSPSKFFYATHELGNVFSAADGGTLVWYPDHVLVDPCAANDGPPNVNLDQIVIEPDDGKENEAPRVAPAVTELRQVCVTRDDVVVSRVFLRNTSPKAIRHRIEVAGDCRGSFDWRGKPGGEKMTIQAGNVVLLIDRNVFPNTLTEGLCMAVGGSTKPKEVKTEPSGTYRMVYEVEVAAKATRRLVIACAVDRDVSRARASLDRVLKLTDPIAENRKDWQAFYERAVPRFTCSDRGLTELYGFRWFLLRFSTAGGNLGYFKYPVVLEGRQAYQTYCCYSAPFLAYDLNWAVDPMVGFGQAANMVKAAYDDGRFPWYTSPRTNRVPIHHRSGTGLSLLPAAAWRHFVIHGDRKLLAELYPGMKKNAEWWLSDRGSDGLYLVDHQLETGMDDLLRWSGDKAPARYEAVDASSYAYLNLRAVEKMARALGKTDDARKFAAAADKTSTAINARMWDSKTDCWRDSDPRTGKQADMLAVTTFYPFFAGIGGEKQMNVFRKHLLNPDQFWLAHPVPALAKDDKRFRPDAFWAGPSWPAATSHVVEAFATSAKTLDRSLLPRAAKLFKRAAANHLRPRADFSERYNPLTGEPLSAWADYMHSWWIDLIIRHAAGLMIQDDGSLLIDPLPLDLDHFALRGVPWRGRLVDVLWKKPGNETKDSGLTVRVDGKVLRRVENFRPGEKPIVIRQADVR